MLFNDKENHTDGSIFRSLVSLAIPIILANIFQTAYQLIDTFWLGRLGANAVAAVSISFPLLFLVLSVGGGLTLAGTVIVSHYKGAEDQRGVNFSSAQTVFIIFIVSIFLSVIGYTTAAPLMNLVGAGPEIFAESVNYFQISSIGFVFLFMFYVFQSLMRGIGKRSEAPMLFRSEVLFYDLHLKVGNTVKTPGLDGHTGFMYLFSGSVAIEDHGETVEEGDQIIINDEQLTLKANEDSDLVFFVLDAKAPYSRNGLYTN